MSKRNKVKSLISIILAVCMMSSFITTAFAAQSNEYVDPADRWLPSSGRTNELDVNATTTYETQYCTVCQKETTVLTYRVPEYTKSGTTALNHGVQYSDGTCIDGESKGNVDSGTPGIDAYYTGYHWTKVVCQTCGTINSTSGPDTYSFNKNVYGLYDCDHNFFMDFDATTYEPYNENYHTTILKKGEYCQFCKGTYAKATEKREVHNFTKTADGQIGNNRFYVKEVCDDCGFETSEYVTAKSVIASYYGKVDGKAHTLTVTDLSDQGVKTSIRYGNTADSCTMTSAPNFTEEGYNTVYYKITYTYDGETMEENGVSYVWLISDEEASKQAKVIVVQPKAHEHDYHFLETVAPSCTTLGYDRFQCGGCGEIIKTNYVQAHGHDYKTVTVREATCKQGGLKLEMCNKCGDFHEITTPTAEHKYHSVVHNPTCRMTGYTDHICEVCGNNYITDITPIISHSYTSVTKKPTCTDKGYTTYTCSMCGFNYVSDYTEPTGHDWDDGHTVTSSTCDAEGVIEYDCKNCNEKMIKATNAKGHTPGKAATCTEPQVCEDCGTVLEFPKGHTYESKVIPATCKAMGYTVNKCKDCGDEYISDYTDKKQHHCHKDVTAPTCTASGYTTYTCIACGDTYVSDYTDKLPHNFKAEVTKPTCTSMGFTTYTCPDCGESYVGDYTDVLPHDYNKVVTAPTCTEHGFTTYTCKDCGDEYVTDYVDAIPHDYKEEVIKPTCTEMGYTTFICKDCGHTFKGAYTDKIAHDYEVVVTKPTCTEFGYSTYTCKDCGLSFVTDHTDKLEHNLSKVVTQPTCTTIGYTTYTCSDCGHTYKADYKEQKGHTPSEWIIDEPATIEHAGEKHIECTECHEVMSKSEIAQLIETDRSDEDGKSEVGDYFIILTDKNGKPVFDSEIIIDVNDNIFIKLPSGRLLDYNDQTTVTVIHTESKAPADGLNIFIYDKNNNAATGTTDENGQINFPNNQSSTTDDSGTIGGGDEEVKETYVVRVTDKNNVIIPNCDVYIGESNNIVVDLPDGIKPTGDNPVIVTVTDQDGNAQVDVTVIVLGDADFIEKGKTDMYGKVTLPSSNEGYTDKDGKVRLQDIYVVVNDETKPVENAFVKLNDDGTISVVLPDGTEIDYANRITVTVSDKDGNALENISVTVSDNKDNSAENLTDEDGKAIVPPTDRDYTDVNGYGELDGYAITVKNADGAIEKAYIVLDRETGVISVTLPEGMKIDNYNNRVTVTVTMKSDKSPVKDIEITITDTPTKVDGEEVIQPEPKTATGKTDSNGSVTFPPLSEDITDEEGKSDVTEEKTIEGEDKDGDGEKDTPDETVTTTYYVSVKDTKGIVENSFIEIKDGKVYVTLPDTNTLTTSNQTTVTVIDKDGKPVKGVSVTVTDKNKATATKDTDINGQITVPVKSSGGGGGGSSRSSGGGGGSISTNTVNIKITDKDGKAVTGFSKSTDSNGKITITLPSGKLLGEDDYYTVTATDSKGVAKTNTSITLKDKNGNTATGTTNNNGVVILPGKEHKAYIVGYEDGTFRPNSDMSRAEAVTIFARLISNEKGEAMNGKSSFKDISSKEWYANAIGYLEKYDIIKGYSDNTFKPDEAVTRAEFVTMAVRYYDLFNDVKIGGLTVKYTDVAPSYWAYDNIAYAKNIGWLNGYADGTFKGDNNITRAEVVTVVNRATGRNADEKYINANYTKLNRFTDVKDSNEWFFDDVFEAANTHIGIKNADSETWVK